MLSDKLKKYPKTDMFEIIGTIGIPHPFCITHHHVIFTSDNYGGKLDSDAINAYEVKTGRSSCGVKGCNLMYEEHETSLLVEVSDPKKRELHDIPGLQDYLLKCKPLCKTDNYAGFSFKQK